LSLTRFVPKSIFQFRPYLQEPVRKAAKQKLMYFKCAHPDCSSDFDYGQGRLFRFQQSLSQPQQPTHWHAVKHYWLCGRCCENYTIEYQKRVGVLLMERLEKLAPGQAPSYSILQGEKAPSPRRLRRARARARQAIGELSPSAVSAIEVLETRNMERRGQSP
jgi:hypothetical protein